MKKPRQTGPNAEFGYATGGRGMRRRSRLFAYATQAGELTDQALALLSTARSERSA